MDRRNQPPIENDLKRKMVLLAGPRQCGKTTLAQTILKTWKGSYYSWDVDRDRKNLLHLQMNESSKLWVFDELHKYRRWRNWLKGVYDLHHPLHSILVTGSARLDLYHRGGDSLQGRYFFHRLHPFTLSELEKVRRPFLIDELPQLGLQAKAASKKIFDDLLVLGGFPEPFLGGSQKEAARWRLAYGSRIVREEIRSLESIQNLDQMELLYDRLPAIVGSVLSVNSLREDLEVAFGTVKNWLSVFEKMYSMFRISPFGAPRIKAVKKEQKLYLWDWARVENPGSRLENLVASHLLRLVHWLEDMEGEKMDLRYFRDTVGREVDFILVRKGKPWMAIEVKSDEGQLDTNLKYFLERVKVPYAFQVHGKGEKHWRAPDINGCKIQMVPAGRFLLNLP